MTLKNKLFCSILLLLALMASIAFAGWWAMGNMNNQAVVSSKVESSLTSMLLAQCGQLIYGMSSDKKVAAEVNGYIADSEKNLQDGMLHMVSEDRKNLGRTVLDFLGWYKPAFQNLTELDAKSTESQKRMIESTAPVIDQFNQLMLIIRTSLLANFTEDALLAFEGVQDARFAFMDARVSARAFISNPDETTAQNSQKSLITAREKIQMAKSRLKIPANIKLTDNILRDMDAYISYFQNTRDSILESYKATMTIREKMMNATEVTRELSDSAMSSIDEAQNSGNTVSLAVSGLSLLIGIAIALLLSSNVQAQLGKDPAALALIAQRVTNGDYAIDDGSRKIGVYGNLVAMVGALEENIAKAKKESERAQVESTNAMEAMKNAEAASQEAKAKTQVMLTAADKLEEVANIVSSASTELSAQIEQSERGASEQAARVTETATAMEEMNSTVLEVAKNAGSAAEVSTATRQKAENGAEVVRKAVQSIQVVQEQAGRLREDMLKLDENAKAISQIMGVISDIADQTNLLALNAAIEAARAGEAGRGFAVVADEVRKLAEKTMASTTDVGNAIRAIQQSASQSMAQVDASSKAIEQATQYVNESGAALSEIVSMVDNTADQVRAIATASEEQSSSSEEINQSITQVNSIAGETARSMAEAASAVSDLANQSQVLTKLIDDMKRG